MSKLYLDVGVTLFAELKWNETLKPINECSTKIMIKEIRGSLLTRLKQYGKEFAKGNTTEDDLRKGFKKQGKLIDAILKNDNSLVSKSGFLRNVSIMERLLKGNFFRIGFNEEIEDAFALYINSRGALDYEHKHKAESTIDLVWNEGETLPELAHKDWKIKNNVSLNVQKINFPVNDKISLVNEHDNALEYANSKAEILTEENLKHIKEFGYTEKNIFQFLRTIENSEYLTEITTYSISQYIENWDTSSDCFNIVSSLTISSLKNVGKNKIELLTKFALVERFDYYRIRAFVGLALVISNAKSKYQFDEITRWMRVDRKNFIFNWMLFESLDYVIKNQKGLENPPYDYSYISSFNGRSDLYFYPKYYSAFSGLQYTVKNSKSDYEFWSSFNSTFSRLELPDEHKEEFFGTISIKQNITPEKIHEILNKYNISEPDHDIFEYIRRKETDLIDRIGWETQHITSYLKSNSISFKYFHFLDMQHTIELIATQFPHFKYIHHIEFKEVFDNSKNDQYLKQLAEELFKMERYTEVLEVFEYIMDRDNPEINYWQKVIRGVSHYKVENYSISIALLEIILRQKYDETHERIEEACESYLFQSYSKEKLLERGIDFFEYLYKRNYNSYRLKPYLVSMYYQKGDYLKAQYYCQRSDDIFEGNCWLQLKNKEEAILLL